MKFWPQWGTGLCIGAGGGALCYAVQLITQHTIAPPCEGTENGAQKAGFETWFAIRCFLLSIRPRHRALL